MKGAVGSLLCNIHFLVEENIASGHEKELLCGGAQGDSSVGKVLGVQAEGPEFRSVVVT